MKKKKTRRKSISNAALRKYILSGISALMLLISGWYFTDVTDVQFPDSETPSLLYSTESKNDLRQTYHNAIQKAKKSITFVIYTLTDPTIIKSLKDKSLEGCDVKVICHADKSSVGLEEKLGPKVELLKRFTKGLMHLKVLVIDDKETWIGSANMTTASLRHHNNLVAAIDSVALAHFAKAKADSFTITDRKANFPHKVFHIGNQKLELCFLPDDKTGVTRINNLIRSAKKTLRIAMFTWTRQDLANAVIDAKKRGVDVRVALDSNSAAGASSEIYQLLKKKGIPVKLNKGNTLLHHKFMYIDGKTLVNGSANWTASAFTKNDDCFFILHDLTEDQRTHLENSWEVLESECI
jgi:phosphatidylserine/phosphatidylglycerophosphate/cardiolipin synthase-like enzyme